MEQLRPDYWERRGPAIYVEEDAAKSLPAQLVADLHPTPTDVVQRIVDAHNDTLDRFIEEGA